MTTEGTAGKPKEPLEVSAEDARRDFGELLSRVAFGRETIVITRYDKPVARLVPLDSAA